MCSPLGTGTVVSVSEPGIFADRVDNALSSCNVCELVKDLSSGYFGLLSVLVVGALGEWASQ